MSLSDARRKAWETRRAKYGPRGHNGYKGRPAAQPDLLRRALALIMRLHAEEVLSEGQCCEALDLYRVEFRVLRDEIRPCG